MATTTKVGTRGNGAGARALGSLLFAGCPRDTFARADGVAATLLATALLLRGLLLVSIRSCIRRLCGDSVDGVLVVGGSSSHLVRKDRSTYWFCVFLFDVSPTTGTYSTPFPGGRFEQGISACPPRCYRLREGTAYC